MIKATRVGDIDELRDSKIAGAFELVQRSDGSIGGMSFICPCGCGRESYMPFKTATDPERSGWDWDGNKDRPTLRPSVFNSGMPCQWHGWLTDGEWVSC